MQQTSEKCHFHLFSIGHCRLQWQIATHKNIWIYTFSATFQEKPMAPLVAAIKMKVTFDFLTFFISISVISRLKTAIIQYPNNSQNLKEICDYAVQNPDLPNLSGFLRKCALSF